MTEPVIQLLGKNGYVTDEKFYIQKGQTITIGRSRSCTISLKFLSKYMALSPTDRKLDKSFLSISRKHLTISYNAPDNIVIEDSSSNGTFVNEVKVKKLVISDLKDRKYIIKLGDRETFEMFFIDSIPDPSMQT